MEKNYALKYGNEVLQLKLKEENVLQVLQSNEVYPIEDIEKELNYLIDNPTDSKPFNEIFNKEDKVVIIVSDITRLWIRTSVFLPIIIKRLNLLGIKDNEITILIANGTHRGQTPEEVVQIVGEEIYNRIEVIDHNCEENLIYVGTTSRGTEVEVNKLVMERKVILTGGIVHHLMAGFGGGRKSILPGVSSKKTIDQNHLHALDPDCPHSSPLIGVGVLGGNPLNLDMIEASAMVNPDFLINSIVDTKGNIVKLAVGHWLKAWEEGCLWADDKFGVPIKEKADLVIASCGGFPKDISLYQGTKSLFNAAKALKPNGTLLLLAECRDGAGADDFFNWIEPLKKGVLDPELRKNFSIPGYIFYAAIEACKVGKVILLSSIDPTKVLPMGITAVSNITDAVTLAGLDKNTDDSKIIIMPYAGSTIPIIQ